MKKLTVKEYLSLSNDERFAAAVDATIAAMGEETFNEYYHDTKNRWRDLAAAWEGVLEYALHHIYWGVYPHNCKDSDLLYLCSLVEAELLDDGEAYEAWSRWSVFERQLEDMAGETCSYGTGIETHFIEHHNYLRARLLCKVKYSKTCPFGYDEYALEYKSYEKILAQLAPETVNWTREQWGEDLNVASVLQRVHGVDYNNSAASEDEYDRAIMMCREFERFGYNEKVIWCAANIEHFPLSMARVLWPVELETTVTRLFLDAYRATVHYEERGQLCLDKKHKYFQAVGNFEREALKASWLCQNVSEWYMAGKYTGQQEKDVKTALFDLEMTC